MKRAPSSEAFQEAIAGVLPSVVFIQVEAVPRGLLLVPPYGEPTQIGPVPVGAGSGMLLDAEGHILTSAHALQRADRVTATLYDGRQLEARVVAFDPATDVAVASVEADALPAATLGDSDTLEVGQWVLAVGSPLGLRFSATVGIVSATGRAIGILSHAAEPHRAAPLEAFVQTDAAINPGNSGGPLVDLDGRIVAMNTAIVSPTGAFTGVGFAVPINLARRVAEDLIRHGEVRRAYLGVALSDVDVADIEVYRLPGPEGAEVIHLEEDSPAARAGIDLGDVIVGVDDTKVRIASDFQAALVARQPGDRVRLHVIRYGEEHDIPVELGLITSGVRPEPSAPVADETQANLGFAAAEEAGRIIIAAVQPFSPAARAGIRPGQVVQAVNRQPVHSAAEFVNALQGLRQDALSLIVEDPQAGRTIINYRVRP
ncbi:MAG TPA: trypsin-like peptidase domain-containing protein [Longimicrobiales bacterium]